tara:strand:+ start:3930 stop:4367 length:438 start_codon:yes stop_codon:yes gene_type:complete
MGDKYVVGHGRYPEEEAMNYIILSSIIMVTACAHSTVPDPKQCCQRLSLHEQEMGKFTRYCKVALFLHRGDAVPDKKIKQAAKQAVNICKFVFGVESEDQLLSVSDLNQGYHKVRHYISPSPNNNKTFWRESLPCDPDQPSCEEF